MTKKEIQLKVGEIPSNAQSDIGVGIVRFDTRLMNELDIHEGDIVEIEGKRKTGAVALRPYPADISLNIVRMDGYLRRNAGTSIGEKVTVKPAEVSEAKKVTLAPAEKGVILQVPPEHVKRALMNRIATKGDIIAPITRRQRMSFGEFFDFDEIFSLGFSETKFTVVNTNPKGITKITDMTQVEVLPQAVEVKEEGKLPVITYEDIGGLREEVKKVREMIELPLRHPELFDRLGVESPKGILLFGPPGTGKTLLARVVANEAGVNFIALNGPEITSKWYGESEKKIRELFQSAQDNAPSIIFIDEIDAIAPKREEVTGEVERRMVAQLLASMDGLKSRGQVIVIAASNRENAIDPALRRPGRFDREIEIGVPDRQGRKEVLQIHTRNMPLDKNVSISKMADITHGFVGADLSALCKEAAMSALRRILPNINLKEKIIDPKLIETLVVNMDDFRNALRFVEPSAMREVLVEIPKITWNDVGGLEDVKQNLREMVEWPLKHPEAFKRMGIKPPRGILLYGVPGNGKTLLARAVANESEANFIAIKGPELFSKWVGESEKHIREMFKRARQVSPAIIFLDEIDALAPKRGHVDSGVTDRVVTQILSEMDGLESVEGIVIIGATNRPDVIDTALLRHGRFDRHIYIPVPDVESRKKIFKVHTKEMPLAKDVSLKKLLDKTEGYVGADIEGLCKEAAILALRENINAKQITAKHFDEALKIIKPSVSKEEVDNFIKKAGETKKLHPEAEEFGYVG
ncbi:MAG: CDC48 family AAA ATPase [archaeon]|nr:CDC48 family AAA ATPase [archaeon]